MRCRYGQQYCCGQYKHKMEMVCSKPWMVAAGTWTVKYPDCSCGNTGGGSKTCTTGRTDYFECNNGQTCNVKFEGWGCCSRRGGRAKCPKQNPYMCKDRTCGGDNCCSRRGGRAKCPKQNPYMCK